MAFLRFLRACAARTGQLLNMADLARDADISFNTAKNWLSILKSSGIVILLEPFHNNLSKNWSNPRSFFFWIRSCAPSFSGWSISETLEAGAMSGAILETWIVAEILKSDWHNGQEAPLPLFQGFRRQGDRSPPVERWNPLSS